MNTRKSSWSCVILVLSLRTLSMSRAAYFQAGVPLRAIICLSGRLVRLCKADVLNAHHRRRFPFRQACSSCINNLGVLLVVLWHTLKSSCGLSCFKFWLLHDPFQSCFFLLFRRERFPDFRPYHWRAVRSVNSCKSTLAPFVTFWRRLTKKVENSPSRPRL